MAESNIGTGTASLGAGGGALWVASAEVGALAGEVVRLWDAAGTLRPGQVLDSAAAAVPGGLLSPACHDLARYWDRELTRLHDALGFVAAALRASAGGYEHTDQAAAASFADSPSETPQPDRPGPGVPIRGGSPW